MKNPSPINIKYRFVPMGATAPDPLPSNEVWVDVGNRVAPRVFDHHSGDTSALSASHLILTNYKELLLEAVSPSHEITLVLHANPDLDAVTGAWLINKILLPGVDFKATPEYKTIVDIVSENDQGLIRTDTPERCWPIVMRLLIGNEYSDLDDEKTVVTSLKLLEKTLRILNQGGSMEDAAEAIITPSVEALIKKSNADYLEDIKRATFFQTRLPSNSSENDKSDWVLVDGIFLHNPTSLLFKELVRCDKKNSPMKKGFPLLIVAWDVDMQADPPLRRYIISTDPLAGVHLKGLGKLLEEMEQAKENKLSIPLLPGRERVGEGKGRHGYNVASPWYDGRGHNFTIVDSPSVRIGKKNVCASILSPEEVLAVMSQFCVQDAILIATYS